MTVTASDTLSNSKVYQTKPAPSDLLSRFTKQYQELQSYKYVRVASVEISTLKQL